MNTALAASPAAHSLTAHMAHADHLRLFDRGRLSATRVVEFLKLSKADVSAIAGVKKNTVRYDHRIPEAVRERLLELANIANLVGDFFQGDVHKVELWFQLPNPLLGNVSPRTLIRIGQYQRVLDFVLDARAADEAYTLAKEPLHMHGMPDHGHHGDGGGPDE